MSRQLSFDSITSGTLAKYKSGWGHWSLFCDRRVLADGTVHGSWLFGINREKDERQIIDYITYEGFFADEGKGWVTSTVRGKGAAVSFMRTCNYYPDLVAGNPRIQASFKALERRVREPTQVKLPATKEVVISAMKRITRSASHSTRDNETVDTAIQSAWLFSCARPSTASWMEGPTTIAYVSATLLSTTGRRMSFAAALRLPVVGPLWTRTGPPLRRNLGCRLPEYM